MYINRFSFRNAFNINKPEIIPESAVDIRMEARGALLEWLDEYHRKLIFGEPCLTECLKRLQLYHEPTTDRSYGWMVQICSKTFHPEKYLVESI